jgi:hypothetical protein
LESAAKSTEEVSVELLLEPFINFFAIFGYGALVDDHFLI